ARGFASSRIRGRLRDHIAAGPSPKSPTGIKCMITDKQGRRIIPEGARGGKRQIGSKASSLPLPFPRTRSAGIVAPPTRFLVAAPWREIRLGNVDQLVGDIKPAIRELL